MGHKLSKSILNNTSIYYLYQVKNIEKQIALHSRGTLVMAAQVFQEKSIQISRGWPPA